MNSPSLSVITLILYYLCLAAVLSMLESGTEILTGSSPFAGHSWHGMDSVEIFDIFDQLHGQPASPSRHNGSPFQFLDSLNSLVHLMLLLLSDILFNMYLTSLLSPSVSFLGFIAWRLL